MESLWSARGTGGAIASRSAQYTSGAHDNAMFQLPGHRPRQPPMMIPLLTVLALMAFAGNSILCRLALGTEAIDAVSFTSVRLGSGAVTLALILAARDRSLPRLEMQWRSALALFSYALPFAWAYRQLHTGVGALLLFAAVQLTMLVAAMRGGEKITRPQWVGFSFAVLGLTALLLPGASAPPVFESLLMIVAGISWGFYSILGRGSRDALRNTASNFVVAACVVGFVSLLIPTARLLTDSGIALAALSGSLTSGVGYAIWYAVLPKLRASTAAFAQLTVPVIASVGGVVFMAETVSQRLLVASIAILGGTALSVWTSNRPK